MLSTYPSLHQVSNLVNLVLRTKYHPVFVLFLSESRLLQSQYWFSVKIAKAFAVTQDPRISWEEEAGVSIFCTNNDHIVHCLCDELGQSRLRSTKRRPAAL